MNKSITHFKHPLAVVAGGVLALGLGTVAVGSSYLTGLQGASTPVTVAAKKKAKSTYLNVQQLKKGNMTSLVGTWKNPHTGKKLVISSKVIHAPKSYVGTLKKGLLIKNGPVLKGTSEIISYGPLRHGYIVGSIGYMSNHLGDSLAPVSIVPRHKKVTDFIGAKDNSNYKKDRLIDGGGQGGFKNAAYYRVSK